MKTTAMRGPTEEISLEATKILARLIVASTPEDMPQDVLRAAHSCVLHWMGCSIAGSSEPSVDIALAAVSELRTSPQASLLGRSERVDMLNAAFINGVSADVLSFSDTHPATLIHAGGVIGSAILALAQQRPISGAQWLHAFVLGFEVACRTGLAIYPWHYQRGWHITGTAGVFGAAAAAAKLLGLDEQKTTWALGLAATQSAGLREMFGSMSKNLHIGRAAQNGLFSALLASKGFTSSEQSLEAPRGYLNVLGDTPNIDAITADFGRRFEILTNTYKPYPCGVVMHPAIEGCIAVATSQDISARDVARIVLSSNPLVLELTGKKRPTTMLEAKLSVYHAAAIAVICRRASQHEFEPAIVLRPDVMHLRDRVEVVCDTSIREDESRVQIGLIDGRCYEHHVRHVAGSAARPMSEVEIEQKFRGLVQGRLAQHKAEALISAILALEKLDDVAVLAELATPDPSS